MSATACLASSAGLIFLRAAIFSLAGRVLSRTAASWVFGLEGLVETVVARVASLTLVEVVTAAMDEEELGMLGMIGVDEAVVGNSEENVEVEAAGGGGGATKDPRDEGKPGGAGGTMPPRLEGNAGNAGGAGGAIPKKLVELSSWPNGTPANTDPGVIGTGEEKGNIPELPEEWPIMGVFP